MDLENKEEITVDETAVEEVTAETPAAEEEIPAEKQSKRRSRSSKKQRI